MDPKPDAVEAIRRLTELGQRLATAESLTGGLVAAALTDVPGASAAFVGGVVAYQVDQKVTLAGVAADLLAAHGPVSAHTAAALAQGVCQITGADWGLATTGVAGPEPHDGEPPGVVWIAVAGPLVDPEIVRYHFSGDRTEVRTATVDAALSLLAGAVSHQGSVGTNLAPRGVATSLRSQEPEQVESDL